MMVTRLMVRYGLSVCSSLGGGILYAGLRCDFRKMINLYLPVFCLVSFNAFLCNESHAFQNPEYNLMFISKTMMRGMSEMGFGILVAYVFQQKTALFIDHKKSLDILAIISLLIMLLISLTCNSYDYLALIATPILITSSFTNHSLLQRIFSNKCWTFLGGLAMEMLFIHLFVASVYYILSNRYDWISHISSFVMVFIYLVIVILSAYTLRVVSNQCNHHFFNKQRT